MTTIRNVGQRDHDHVVYVTAAYEADHLRCTDAW
jgi:hypothetical protein